MPPKTRSRTFTTGPPAPPPTENASPSRKKRVQTLVEQRRKTNRLPKKGSVQTPSATMSSAPAVSSPLAASSPPEVSSDPATSPAPAASSPVAMSSPAQDDDHTPVVARETNRSPDTPTPMSTANSASASRPVIQMISQKNTAPVARAKVCNVCLTIYYLIKYVLSTTEGSFRW